MTRGKIAWVGALVFWHSLIWWLSNQPDLHSGLAHDFIWRKIAHVLEFVVLTVLWVQVLRKGPITVDVVFTAWLLTLGYAALDEWHQSWVAGRYGTVRDVLIDMSGVTLLALVYGLRTKKPPERFLS